MKRYILYMFFGGLIFLVGCQGIERKELRLPGQPVTIVDTAAVLKTDSLPTEILETGKTRPAEVVSYARTLLGTPYLYASANPANGFDCSGFITYVFNHFGIQVPRSSVDFTNVGKEIPLEKARSGDIILFTGTDSTIPVVGHMGIITTSEKEAVQFIHSTSGKAKGVVITPLENYYRSRFVKVIRIFPDYYFTEV